MWHVWSLFGEWGDFKKENGFHALYSMQNKCLTLISHKKEHILIHFSSSRSESWTPDSAFSFLTLSYHYKSLNQEQLVLEICCNKYRTRMSWILPSLCLISNFLTFCNAAITNFFRTFFTFQQSYRFFYLWKSVIWLVKYCDAIKVNLK